jgi:hypothetical protein
MAGSQPDFGMAEPASWIDHDHNDLKDLNCVLTRVHWQQDRRVLDYCDRHGILIQVEVPTWGPGTFRDLGPDELEAVTSNGLSQLVEMIGRDRNHPCVFSWGLCNEVDGQNPAAQEFVRRMLRQSKRLDPSRLCSYASNSLQTTPERDVAGEMDFVEWNEYYETWYGGDPGAMRRNLERGVLMQRVHGVVDVFGARKPSFEALRRESSPVESLEVRPDGGGLLATVRTRKDLPSYTLGGYKIRWTAYGKSGIPLERAEALLPDIAPGGASETRFGPISVDVLKIQVEVLRPTGFPTASVSLRPSVSEG